MEGHCSLVEENPQQSRLSKSILLKLLFLIIMWNVYSMWNVYLDSYNVADTPKVAVQGCEYRCKLIDKAKHKIYNRSASAYIIHAPSVKLHELPAPSSQYLNVFFAFDSPAFMAGKNVDISVPQYTFNATMTYNKNSEYFFPFGSFERRLPSDPAEVIITEKQVHLLLLKTLKMKCTS
ncbi:unnamed protein product [Cylicocyclus nassatus]|uniref:Fucosyltransferase N-terminal domain-containing protein n=1 Tax=Cylicocyclus nassatus TaxID=53992 RepID=A0AA36GCE9_CYLNA|nr:unnamed protein product [Cylicocyclus nassatus]